MAKLAWRLTPIDPLKDFAPIEMAQIFSPVKDGETEKLLLKPRYLKTKNREYSSRSAKLNRFGICSLVALVCAIPTSYVHSGEYAIMLKLANLGLWIMTIGLTGAFWRNVKRPIDTNLDELFENSTICLTSAPMAQI